MESRHCGQDKRIFFCPVHNASTPCSLQAFGIRCIVKNIQETLGARFWTFLAALLFVAHGPVSVDVECQSQLFLKVFMTYLH